MAKKRSEGRPRSKSARDLPVRSAGKVKGGNTLEGLDDKLGTMSDLGSDYQLRLQQATQQAAMAAAAASNVQKKASDTQSAIIKNLKA